MVEIFAAVFAMELITILNHCHRLRGFVYHQDHFTPDQKAIEIGVRPRAGSAAICSGCHKPAPGYDHLPERRFEFIPFWGILVFFLYRMRRVNCRDCGVVVEEVPWCDGKHQLTRAYMLFLARWARRLSWTETAEAFHTSWDKVCDAVEYVVTWGLQHRTLAPIRAIGVDEIQYAKGHKYLTLVYQIDADLTRLLWVGKERTAETFQGFFRMIGEELTGKIEFVCSDMWKPYLRVIREKCSQALHILDRFHIVAKMNETPLAGSAPLQPANRSRLSPQGRFPAVLELQLARLGRHVPGLLVLPGHAFPHRAHEENRSDASRPPATAAQLFQGQKATFQRASRGVKQQSQSHHEKIVRLPNLPHPRTGALSRTWQAT